MSSLVFDDDAGHPLWSLAVCRVKKRNTSGGSHVADAGEVAHRHATLILVATAKAARLPGI